MVHRRRPTKPRLILLTLGIVSPCLWANQLEVHSTHSALRFEVPDLLYQAGATADFAGLQIVDGAGQNLAYAVCAEREQRRAQAAVPVMGLPDLARPQLDADNALSFSHPAGAGSTQSVVEWVLDLRQLEGATGTLMGLPPIAELRISPNLQQWSAALEFQQNGETLSFEPRPLSFVRVRPQSAPAGNQPPPTVIAVEEQQRQARAIHWFEPPRNAQGHYLNPRRLPIFAARLKTERDIASADWALQSRQGEWDAWKPRGRVSAGSQSPLLRFSAVTDPQWRVGPHDTDALELGHARYELRIPDIAHSGPLRMLLHERGGFGPSLSCRSTENLPIQAPERIEVVDEDSATAQTTQPNNLRNGFLLLVMVVIGAGLIARRFLLRRQGR
ncbi:MAG: DUF3999 family protein [Oceanococcus sp.]|nr:MAG: DUF3999 family protein [Oceanococcus sp.]